VLIYAEDTREKGESSVDKGNVTSSKAQSQRSSEDEGTMDVIRRYFAEKLGFFDDDKKEVPKEKSKVK
jgi:hypothetical protein